MPELAADLTQEAFVRLLVELDAGRQPDDVARVEAAAVAHRLGLAAGSPPSPE